MDMQPNEQPQEQHPIDYLDSISSVPKGAKQGPSDKLFFGAIVGALLVALIIGVLAFLATGTSTKDDFATLSVRLANLQTVADEAQDNIVSGDLRATNTSLSLVLTNANRDIEETLTAYELSASKPDPKIAAAESTEELSERLEDARLNAIFDRIYAREMTYQLETMLILIEQIQERADSSAEQEFLSTTIENMRPLQERFSKFDAASS